MNRTRFLVLIAILIAVAIAAYLANGLMSKKPAPQAVVEKPKSVTVDVLFAAKDLALGEKMVTGALEWRPWPRDNIGTLIDREAKPDALEKLANARARQPIYAGEPVIERKLVTADNGSFMSAILPQGMRAISVAISEHSAVSGFILPNDRVDVIVTRRYDGDAATASGQKLALTETVLRNVRVLAINQTFRQEGDDRVTVPEGKTAVLELDPRQTEVITKAEALGELSLSLRSLAEGGEAGARGARPELSEAYKNEDKSPNTGPLVIRYGVATSADNP